ncbi:MAG: ArnT family glycosyltransferase [Candidatus Acidiferrales bacterium]
MATVSTPEIGEAKTPADALTARDQRTTKWRKPLILAVVLAVIALVISREAERGEFNMHSDEAQHAMTGLFFADFLRDLPLSDPIEYAFRYYAQYPSLGLIHWPPIYHLSEGVMFLLLGPSAVAARLTTLTFTLIGCAYWFRLVRWLTGETAAAVATLLLAFNPELLLYEKAAMLEAPSVALAIAASYYWLRYLRQSSRGLLVRFVIFACLALLTKQTTVYLAVFCFLTLVVRSKWQLLRQRDILTGIVVCLLVLGPFFVTAFVLHGQTINYDVVKRGITGHNPLLFYLTKLPSQLGMITLVLSVAGILSAREWDQRENSIDMGAWILACYLTFTVLAGKETRYILYWLPPFIYFASGFLVAAWGPRWRRVAGAVAALILLTWQSVVAWEFQRPYVSGFQSAASRVVEEAKSGIVLFDGELPGNFAFFVRKFDEERDFVILRKALYASRISKEFGHEELVSTRAEILEIIRSYGIRHIIVSDSEDFEYEAQRLLRQLLATDDFELYARHPIETNVAEWKNRNLLLYRYKHATPRTAQVLRIRMLTLSRDIVVSLDDLGIP